MSWAISVTIVAVICLIFNMGYIDGDASSSLFWGIINFVISFGFIGMKNTNSI